MRSAYQRTRAWILLPAVVLVLSLLAPACSSSTPSYCGAGDELKTSVQKLGDVNIAKNGLDSLQTALSNVQTNATKLANEAKSTFAAQTEALKKSLSGLVTALKSAQGQSPATAASTIKTSLNEVKTSASELESAVSDKC